MLNKLWVIRKKYAKIPYPAPQAIKKAFLQGIRYELSYCSDVNTHKTRIVYEGKSKLAWLYHFCRMCIKHNRDFGGRDGYIESNIWVSKHEH